MNYAIEINAGMDVNGNSRRGWYIYSLDGVLRGFLDSQGMGDHILYAMFRDAVIKLHVTKVPAAEWRAAMKAPQVTSKEN